MLTARRWTWILAPGMLVAACAARYDVVARPPPAAPPPGASPGSWHYEVLAGERAHELAVQATFAAGSPAELGIAQGAAQFVRGLEVAEPDGRWREVVGPGAVWIVPACLGTGCRVRYRFDLLGAARTLDDVGDAANRGGALFAPFSTFLVHPLSPTPERRFRVHVATTDATELVTGVSPAADGAKDTYEGDADDLPRSSYAAFGTFRHHAIDGEPVSVAIGPGALALDDAALVRWVRAAAQAVHAYYGRFPVPRLVVLIVPADGDKIRNGSTMGDGGAAVVMEVGARTNVQALSRDWMMTHELVHTALPNVARTHHWLEEGVADYVEPLARARRGQIDEKQVWRDFVEGMPQGLPTAGDRGLDGTPTWGRTYWGGALFCLLADVEIRRRTENRHSLDDALRAIQSAGGDIRVRWPIERVLQTGDAAVGVPVLQELYARLGNRPDAVDLPALWKRLGVTLRGREIPLDGDAPDSRIRAAITRSEITHRAVADAR